jgi:four helix bundle protein
LGEGESGIATYRDLVVWQKAIDLCVIVYQACSSFPRTELYELADQMKRASVSISSNIAEGQARLSRCRIYSLSFDCQGLSR